MQRYFLARESINSIIEKINNIPLVLRILCGASLVISPLLLVSIFIPELSLAITNIELTSWLPNLINGILLAIIGIGILMRWKLTIVAVILTPVIQDTSFYIWGKQPDSVNIIELASTSLVGAIAFAIYLKFFGGWEYFANNKKKT